MKNIIISVLVISAFLVSCKKEIKPAFDQSPDERLNAALTAYESQLTSAQNGWKGYLTTDSGRGATYSFYFKFNTGNRVVMLSDFDSLSSVTSQESSYRLKALQQPSLIFDTYNYIHVLSDPDPNVNGQVYGAGLLSDFDFYFDSSTTDNVKLIGRVHNSKLTLIKATQAEETSFNNGGLTAGLSLNKIITYFKRLSIGSKLYDVQINPTTRTVTFSWLDASGNFVTFSTGYYSTAGGIGFTNPLVDGSTTISGFDNITFNQPASTLNLTVGGTAATITGIVKPLKVDVNAPLRWWQYAFNNANGYWYSFNGFHVDGVDNAFRLDTLISSGLPYYYLIYWPKFGPTNDLFAPIFLDAPANSLSLEYGSAPRTPIFTGDGRAIFTELKEYPPYPTVGGAALSRDLLYDPTGYYFVQTGPKTYDMVSAANGRSWVSWQF